MRVSLRWTQPRRHISLLGDLSNESSHPGPFPGNQTVYHYLLMPEFHGTACAPSTDSARSEAIIDCFELFSLSIAPGYCDND